MAKTVQEANEKEINLAQELYIHYHKQSYLDYKNKYAPIDMNWGLISSIYGRDAAELRRRMDAIENITNKDGGVNVYSWEKYEKLIDMGINVNSAIMVLIQYEGKAKLNRQSNSMICVSFIIRFY